jgi:hypothetical protein
VDISLSSILLPPNMPSGLKLEVIAYWICHFKWTPMPCDPPIEVSRVAGTEFWKVEDGRHRFFAAYISGRLTIRAIEVDSSGGLEHP